MFDLVITNAKIVTCNKNDEVIETGYIAIQDDKIVEIGTSIAFEKIPTENFIDAGGNLVTAGLIDCHTHLIYHGDRSSEFEQRLEGVSYQEIIKNGGGILSTMRSTREASFDVLEKETLERIKIMHKHGVTSIEIKSGYGLNMQSELKILKVAQELKNKLPISIYTSFLGAHTIPPEFNGDKNAYIDYIIDELLPLVAKEKLADFVDAFCEKDIAFDVAQVERLFLAAKKLGFKTKLHAEQLSNQGGSLMAAKYGACSVDHLEYLPEEDCVKLYAENNEIVAVLLPGAFYFLKETKKPPIEALKAAGIKIAIATDANPGTSPFLSLPLMMNMACIYFNLTINDVFKGVTINAARALDIDSYVGSIEVGKQADLALWKTTNLSSIIYNPTQNFCDKVIKDGKICIS
jgi:imidazolonepropionase